MGCGGSVGMEIPVKYLNYEEVNFEFKENPIVYFDIQIEKQKPQRVLIELFGKRVPKTSENFREFGATKKGKAMCFRGCKFHRIIKKFIIQSGDITAPSFRGGDSIYGERFVDENYSVKHDSAGILSMANRGKNTNCSQFFICLKKVPQFNKNYVAFGKVIEGMKFIKKIGSYGGTGNEGKPTAEISIKDCGEIIEGEEEEKEE